MLKESKFLERALTYTRPHLSKDASKCFQLQMILVCFTECQTSFIYFPLDSIRVQMFILRIILNR